MDRKRQTDDAIIDTITQTIEKEQENKKKEIKNPFNLLFLSLIII